MACEDGVCVCVSVCIWRVTVSIPEVVGFGVVGHVCTARGGWVVCEYSRQRGVARDACIAAVLVCDVLVRTAGHRSEYSRACLCYARSPDPRACLYCHTSTCRQPLRRL